MYKSIQTSLLSFQKNNSEWFWNFWGFRYNGSPLVLCLSLLLLHFLGAEAVNISILLSGDFHISCEMFLTRVHKATLNSSWRSVRWLNSGEDKGKHVFETAHLLSRLCFSAHVQLFFPVFLCPRCHESKPWTNQAAGSILARQFSPVKPSNHQSLRNWRHSAWKQ